MSISENNDIIHDLFQEIDRLHDLISDVITDYDIATDEINRLSHLLNDRPHSSDVTLSNTHTIINYIFRITSLTQKEHLLQKNEIRERLEVMKNLYEKKN